MSIKKDILWRVSLVYFCILLLGILIIGKAVYIQIAEKQELVAKASEMGLRNIIVEPNRGNIYAANEGRVLASSVPYYEIRMDLATKALTDNIFYSEVDSLAWHLSRLFRDKSKEHYKKDLTEARRRKKRYHLIKRYVDYDELQALKKFPIFRRGQYGGGFIIINMSKRFQPHGMLASRTIGYTSRSQRGNVVGIEGAYDHVLRGKQGLRLMQRLPGGTWVPVNNGTQVEPRDGMDVVTTIDVNIQDVAESALLQQMDKHQAHHGCAVLMEVKTGSIRAIANLERDSRGRYRERYNYALGEQGLSEPGSTFKLASMIALLEDGHVHPDDSVDTGDGVIYKYGEDIRDTKPKGYGTITVQRAFEVSSNVGIAIIMMDSYNSREKEK
ncbi:MAG: penicillin-binding transpeptidase domain-containing protein, partial [Bacteroidota bacterium]